jgi:uncharacterized protein (TIGR03067 family)
MKRLHDLLPSLIAIMMVCCAPAGRSADDLSLKGTGMEGTWICLSAIVNGKPLPDTTVKLLRLTLTKDRYKTEKGTEVLFDSRYSLDPGHRPPHIDIVGTEGELAGKAAQGIYLLSEGTLKLCYTMPGKNRPLAFESAVGSDAFLLVWQRQK